MTHVDKIADAKVQRVFSPYCTWPLSSPLETGASCDLKFITIVSYSFVETIALAF